MFSSTILIAVLDALLKRFWYVYLFDNVSLLQKDQLFFSKQTHITKKGYRIFQARIQEFSSVGGGGVQPSENFDKQKKKKGKKRKKEKKKTGVVKDS